jgi:ribose 5-phosphate isomerase RpiB
METILIGSDHAGFNLKTFLKDVMEQDGLRVIDVGLAATRSTCTYCGQISTQTVRCLLPQIHAH